MPLTFSDASALGGEMLVFTASAEDSSDGGGTGSIVGSVVGTIDLAGEVRRLHHRASTRSRVHAVLDSGVITMTFVCDQDDPDTTSPLLSATMGVEAGQT